MECVKYDENVHHEELASWMIKRGWPILPQWMLPKDGFVVPGVCCGFIYRSDERPSIAFFEWIFTSPDATSESRNEGLDILIEHAMEFCRISGVKSCISFLSDSGLISRYVDKGFSITETNMTGLVRRF